MNARVRPVRRLAGTITVPGDKSVSHRAALLGALADGPTEIQGFLEGEDCLATLRAVAALGAEVARKGPGHFVIQGVGLDGLTEPEDVVDCGNAGTMARLEGAYSIVAIADGTLVAFRDPLGIRPLTLGRIGDDWVVASETCALDLVGADVVRDVLPGEVVWVDAEGSHSAQAVPRGGRAACIFEHVYFARPDSSLGGTGVHAARVRMGERLAEEAPVDADLVMPIPDSGTPAAIGYAKRSGIPYEEGLIKNRYVGRTFIQPDQELRRQGIRLKFNPLDEIAGRRLVIVDDSIVRGNTMRALVQMLGAAGAAEVHVRISSPPVVSPCFYGIDMADEAELAAAHRSVEEMREHVGATSLHYLSLDGMQWATGIPEEEVCRACFTRRYPTPIPAEGLAAKHRFEHAAR